MSATEIAIVIDHGPSEAEAKALAEIGFTNIMVDLEKKLLVKALNGVSKTTVKIVERMPDKEELQALVQEGVARVIYNPPVPPPGTVTPMDPSLADEPVKDISELPEIPKAPENVTKIADAKQQKLNKLQVKKFQIYLERRKRAINKGVPEEKVDQYLREEDFRNMSPAEKIQRLEGLMARTFQGFSQDLIRLRQNDGAIGDAFDINNRAMLKMFIKLGLTPEDQKAIMEEAAKEFSEEKAARIAARQKAQEEAQKKADEEAEKAKLVQETKDAPAPTPQGVEPPTEATQFGG